MKTLMALMEFPSIFIGLFLVKTYAQQAMAYPVSGLASRTLLVLTVVPTNFL